jgi:transcriptional regulator with XRE-family HTH domain
VTSNNGLFPALLKHWRNLRGLSQLDLALAADVSPRHVSFLETGRAKPSKDMVLVLAANLNVPLRDQNALLRSAGFDNYFDEPALNSGQLSPIDNAIRYMLEKHDPFPMVVLDATYNLVASNTSASKILQLFVLNPTALKEKVNLLEMIFHPELCRPFVENWEQTAHIMLARLHRESLEKRHDQRLKELLETILKLPDVPESWRQPNFTEDYYPSSKLTLKKDSLHLSFLMTMTCFSSPQSITVEELMIESYFPLDQETEKACIELCNS